MRRDTAARAIAVACVAAAAAGCVARSAPAAFDLGEATVRTLLQDQQSGRRTARQIAEQYLSRIQAFDRRGPSLNSIIELNPDALTIADALDAQRRTSGLRGPLHGIPV